MATARVALLSKVVPLTSMRVFEENVRRSSDMWIVLFLHAPAGVACDTACQAQKRQLRYLSATLDGNGVRFGIVNCALAEGGAVCAELQVALRADIRLFPRGIAAKTTGEGTHGTSLIPAGGVGLDPTVLALKLAGQVLDVYTAHTPVTQGGMRRRVAKFYKRHNPQQLHYLEELLQKYDGEEERLLRALHDKYGVEYDPEQEEATAAEADGLDSWKEEL